MSKTELKSSPQLRITDITSVLEPERVGIYLIRLLERPRNARAVLRSFSAADKILAHWSLEFGGAIDCEFEITYNDGFKVSGDFRFLPKGSAKPALTRYLRSAALAVCRGEPCLLIRGLVGNDFVFLDRYETDDWPMQVIVRAASSLAIPHSASYGSAARFDSLPTVERK